MEADLKMLGQIQVLNFAAMDIFGGEKSEHVPGVVGIRSLIGDEVVVRRNRSDVPVRRHASYEKNA